MAAVADGPLPLAESQTTSSSPSWTSEKRWENFRESREQKSLKVATNKTARKRKISQLTQQERNAHSKLPLELLAKEWLNEQRAGIDTRCYLVEKLLPTLVVGLEKLLTEVSLRDLTDTTEMQPDFNPVNFVAQYLMRNNPRYSNFAEAHPYCRTMKQVAEEVKRVAYSLEENRLAELKTKTKHRRVERERAEAVRAAEEKRREGSLTKSFSEWLLPTESSISLADLKLAVQSWLEMMTEHTIAPTLQDLFTKLLSSEERQLREKQFVSAVMERGCELPSDMFDLLSDHLGVCGVERRRNKLKELRRELIGGVFADCDPDKTGVVDRLRVLHLFACFYDTASSDVQSTLHNPRKWPIVEVIEAEEMDDGDEEGSTTSTTLSEQDYREFLNGSSLEEEGGLEKETKGREFLNGSSLEEEGGLEKETKGGATTSVGETDASQGGDTDKKREGGEEEAVSETKKEEEDTERKENGGEGDKKKDSESLPPTSTDATKVGGAEKEPETDQSGDIGEQGKTAPPPPPSSGGPNTQEPPESDQKEYDRSVSSARPPHSVSVLEGRLRAKSTSISRMRRLSGMSVTHPVRVSGPGSAWDHCMLTCAQFVQLVELFLGPEPEDSTVDAISTFFRSNYTETAQERSERLEVAQQQALVLSKRHHVSSLFDLWDNDRSGYLELEELQLVLSKWKGFSSEQAKEQAEEILSSLGAQQNRLTQLQFQIHIEQLTDGMELSEFEDFVEYLVTSVKLTFEEQRRGDLRSKFLSKIVLAGKTSGLEFSQAMKAAIAVLHQDISEFGGGKSCTVAMALLEPSTHPPGSLCLSYKAASSSIEGKVVGRKLHRTFKQGVSFLAVDAGRPVHVANIQKHGRVYFFVPEHKIEDYKGSLVVSPIITPRQTVIGAFSIDTLTTTDESTDVSFRTHEINFHQGVGVCLGEVYHWINARQQLLKVSQSALSWVHRRCPQVTQAEVYIIEPPKEEESTYTLRCMLTTTGADNTSNKKPHKEPLHRSKNLFRDYLFQCADNSEPVSADAYGRHHLAYPIRDHTGCAVAVVDFCMPPTHTLKVHQMRELTRVLKLLTVAYYHLSYVQEQRIGEEGEEREDSTKMLGLDVDAAECKDITLLFDKLMLADLRESMSKLNKRMFAELRSYIEPPEVILRIIKALLYIIHPHQEFNTWAQCKQYITLALVKTLESYDPLKKGESHQKLELINEILKGVTPGSIQMQGSLPAKYIYSWVSICVSLLEHSSSANNQQTPPSSLTTTASNSATTSQGALSSSSRSSVKEKGSSTLHEDGTTSSSNPPPPSTAGGKSDISSSSAATSSVSSTTETPTVPNT